MKDSTVGGGTEDARPECPPDEPHARAAYRVGDEIIFKYEGNLRACVEGCGAVGGRVWLEVRARYGFLVPLSQVVGVEGEELP